LNKGIQHFLAGELDVAFGSKPEMRLAQLPLVTPLVRLARSARELLKPLAQITTPAMPCSSKRNEPERRPARDPGPVPIAPPFFSRRRPETRSPALPFHNLLRASAGRDRTKHFVAFFFAARSALVRVGFARDDQLAFALRLIPGGGGGLKLLRPAPVLKSLEKR